MPPAYPNPSYPQASILAKSALGPDRFDRSLVNMEADPEGAIWRTHFAKSLAGYAVRSMVEAGGEWEPALGRFVDAALALNHEPLGLSVDRFRCNLLAAFPSLGFAPTLGASPELLPQASDVVLSAFAKHPQCDPAARQAVMGVLSGALRPCGQIPAAGELLPPTDPAGLGPGKSPRSSLG